MSADELRQFCNTIVSMSGAAGAVTWVRARFEALSLRQFMLLAGAIVLLLSGLFGGLKPAQPDTIDTLVPGKERTTVPFTMTVERIRWTKDLGGDNGKPERGRYLLLVAKIRTEEKISVDAATVAAAIRLRGVKGMYKTSFGDEMSESIKAKPRVLYVEDGTDLGVIPSGLTYEVAYVWEQSEAEEIPETVTVETVRHTWRKSSIDEQMMWFDPVVDSTGEFPLLEPRLP